MAQKEKGGLEPTYKVILSKCPAAVLDPETQRPVGKKWVYDVSRDLCYDEDLAKPWKHQKRFHRKAIPPWRHRRDASPPLHKSL